MQKMLIWDATVVGQEQSVVQYLFNILLMRKDGNAAQNSGVAWGNQKSEKKENMVEEFAD